MDHVGSMAPLGYDGEKREGLGGQRCPRTGLLLGNVHGDHHIDAAFSW